MTTTEAPAERDPLAYNVELPQFEGPLDLLLHLIQKHELDILDIPMQFITSRYLAYLDMMRNLTIDVASEYLVMAAVLTHIKSKMLLPQAPSDQPDDLEQELLDPREELVRRLLEYQKFKHAAAELGARGTLGADVFARPEMPEDKKPVEEAPLAKLPVYSLLDAFSKLLDRRKLKLTHEVNFEKLTITDRMNQLVSVLELKKRVAFEDLFEGVTSKFDLVITFLALLEMTKMKMTRLFQADAESGLYVEYAALAEDAPDEGPLPTRRTDDDVRDSEPTGADGDDAEPRDEREEDRAPEAHEDPADAAAARVGEAHEDPADAAADAPRVGEAHADPPAADATDADAADADAADADAADADAADADAADADAADAEHASRVNVAPDAGEPALSQATPDAEETHAAEARAAEAPPQDAPAHGAARTDAPAQEDPEDP